MKKTLTILFALLACASVSALDSSLDTNLQSWLTKTDTSMTDIQTTDISPLLLESTQLDTVDTQETVIRLVEAEGIKLQDVLIETTKIDAVSTQETVLKLLESDTVDLQTILVQGTDVEGTDIPGTVVQAVDTGILTAEEALTKVADLDQTQTQRITQSLTRTKATDMKAFQKAFNKHIRKGKNSPITRSMISGSDAEVVSRLVNDPTMKWWGQKLSNPPQLERQPIPEGDYYKAVSDLRVPQNRKQFNNQLKELRYFKEQGYNSAMIVWRGEKNLKWLRRTFARLDDDYWRFIFAPGLESPYQNPELYRKVFDVIIPYCDFAISGWYHYSNSGHWGNQKKNRKYEVAVLTSLMRETDSDFPVIGETWFQGGKDFNRFEPDYATGTLLVNAMQFLNGEIPPRPEGFADLVDREPLFAIVHGRHPGRYRKGEPDVLFPLAEKLHKMLRESGRYRGSIFITGGGYGNNDLRTTNYHEVFANE